MPWGKIALALFHWQPSVAIYKLQWLAKVGASRLYMPRWDLEELLECRT